jgi:hypothetical protein
MLGVHILLPPDLGPLAPDLAITLTVTAIVMLTARRIGTALTPLPGCFGLGRWSGLDPPVSARCCLDGSADLH